MKSVHSLQYKNANKEEYLPGRTAEFPYIASYCELDKYIGRVVPWHWHKEVELFYVKSGTVEYYTPKGKTVFPAGSGGILNSNVLHTTRPQDGPDETIQLLHIFDPSLIGGQQGCRIEQKFVTPLITAQQVELIRLSADDPAQARTIQMILDSFDIAPEEPTYEIKLRAALSEIWCRLLEIAAPLLQEKGKYDKTNEKLRVMMIYVHEHFSEKLPIAQIAASAFVSERECFRAFQQYLHMTPAEYLKSYRLQKACHMLARSRESITAICHACGLGSSSYFGKTFRESIGCTPLEYRRKWQDYDITGQE